MQPTPVHHNMLKNLAPLTDRADASWDGPAYPLLTRGIYSLNVRCNVKYPLYVCTSTADAASSVKGKVLSATVRLVE